MVEPPKMNAGVEVEEVPVELAEWPSSGTVGVVLCGLVDER